MDSTSGESYHSDSEHVQEDMLGDSESHEALNHTKSEVSDSDGYPGSTHRDSETDDSQNDTSADFYSENIEDHQSPKINQTLKIRKDWKTQTPGVPRNGQGPEIQTRGKAKIAQKMKMRDRGVAKKFNMNLTCQIVSLKLVNLWSWLSR